MEIINIENLIDLLIKNRKESINSSYDRSIYNSFP